MNLSSRITLLADARNHEAVARAFRFDVDESWKRYALEKEEVNRRLTTIRRRIRQGLERNGDKGEAIALSVVLRNMYRPPGFNGAAWRRYLKRGGISTLENLYEVC